MAERGPFIHNGLKYGSEWEKLTDSELEAAFIGDIEQVKPRGKIHIYCGGASPAVLTERFMDSARRVRKEKRASIDVIVGPFLIVDEQGNNPMQTLKEEGVIRKLLHRPTLGDHDFFYVVESDAGYRCRWYDPYPHRGDV